MRLTPSRAAVILSVFAIVCGPGAVARAETPAAATDVEPPPPPPPDDALPPPPEPEPEPAPTPAPVPTPAPAEPAPTPAEPAPEGRVENSTEEAPERTGKPRAKVDSGSPFIKGDLVHVGTRRLLSRFDHVGVSGGATVLGEDAFLTVTPGTAFYLGKFAFSFGVPLNLQAFDGRRRALGSFRVRREDWDEIPDFARVIRFVTYGRKEDELYFTINSLRPATIGHGALVSNYNANVDVDRSMTGLMFDAYNDLAGFQLQANDVTFQNRVLGALVFLKPLSLFSDNSILRSLSIGAEWAGDLFAPRCVRTGEEDDAGCVQGSGNVAGFDPFDGSNLDRTFVRTDGRTGRFVTTRDMAHAAGLSAEIKVLKDANTTDVKLYGTLHQFLNAGGGDGLALGVLGRFNFGGGVWTNALRLRAEYRNFGDGYLPAYFDSLYEIQKFQYAQDDAGFQVTPTKWQAVFGDPANGFARPSYGRVSGYNIDVQWGLYAGGQRGKMLSVGLGLQDSQRPGDTRAHLHLEFPLLGFIQAFGTIMRVNTAGPAELFGADMLSSPQTVVLTGLRFQLLPILFINAHYSRSYRITRSPGSEYHLGNSRVVDSDGNASPYFKADTLFENLQTLFVEIELGWELNRDRTNDDTPPPPDPKDRLGQPDDAEGN